MKKIFTFLLLFSSVLLFSQQVQRQKVVVEVGTGTWCPSCPAVVDILHDFIDEGLEIAIIEYHIGASDPFQNAASLIRDTYYGFPWFPTTYYDSNHIGYDDWATPSIHRSYYEDRMSTLSSFSVDIEAQVNANELSGYISLNKVDEYAGSNLVLHIVLTESNIPYNWQGETELDHAERDMYPDGNGTVLDFSAQDELNEEYLFTLDPSWVTENLEITYFIQDNDTKEILQGDVISIESILSNGGDLSQANNAYFYPNPAQKELFLSAIDDNAVTNIEIYDVLGKKIFSQNEYHSAINIEHLPQGVYLLSFYENDVKKVSKIIKE